MLIKAVFEDTKGVIRIRKLNDRQHNDQKKRDRRTNIELQNTTQKTKSETSGVTNRFTNKMNAELLYNLLNNIKVKAMAVLIYTNYQMLSTIIQI